MVHMVRIKNRRKEGKDVTAMERKRQFDSRSVGLLEQTEKDLNPESRILDYKEFIPARAESTP